MASYKVGEVKVLEKMPQAAEARQTLDKIAWQVEPIMRKHRWQVPVLREFLPRGDGLLGLNVNKGQEIKIRLRKSKTGGFFDYNHSLGTMLHELCHCEHGPHNQAFYKLLDELWEECEELQDRGLGGSGTGFDAAGQKLAGDIHNPSSVREGRRRGAAAAEKRVQRQQLFGRGKLGGRQVPSGLSPAIMAARAAERRLADDQWCQNGKVDLSELETPHWLEAANDPEQSKELPRGLSVSTGNVAASALPEDAMQMQPAPLDKSLVEASSTGKRRREVVSCSDSDDAETRTRVCIGSGRWVSKTSATGKVILEPLLTERSELINEIRQRYRCVSRCVIRAGYGLETERVGVLPVGAEVVAILQRQCAARANGNSIADSETATSARQASGKHGRWQCMICTLMNSSAVVDCGACGLPCPASSRELQSQSVMNSSTRHQTAPASTCTSAPGQSSDAKSPVAAACMSLLRHSQNASLHFWPQCPSCNFINETPVVKLEAQEAVCELCGASLQMQSAFGNLRQTSGRSHCVETRVRQPQHAQGRVEIILD
eukprot:SAG31_NODE_429_length_15801_cov_6.878551_8_plen_545_part_00